MLVISTHYLGGDQPAPSPDSPSPATVMSALYDAVFLDQLDQDELQIQLISRLVSQLPPEKRDGLREIELFVIRPSQNLGSLAFDLKGVLPPTLRYLLDRFGAAQSGSDDFLSTLLFHHTYIERLLEIGEQDGMDQADGLDDFLGLTAAVNA